jgi:hypothetical protein
MDELLVEVCRSGRLAPLVLGSSPDEAVRAIGEPQRIKNGQGDDCFQTYRYSGLQLGMRCFNLHADVRRGAVKDLALTSIRIEFRGRDNLTCRKPSPARRSPQPERSSWTTHTASSPSTASR